MKISKITLRNLFSKGQKPNQEAFFNFFDSFWHKDEEINQSSVKGLESTLSNKLDKGVETTLLNAFNDAVKTSVSGVKGEAFPNSSPTHYDPATYPNGLYEKWDVTTAGTYVNFIKADNNPVEVTTADLNLNQIQIAVTNGVAKKLTKLLPQAQNKIDVWVAGNYSSGKQVINPDDQSIYEANTNVTSTDIPGISNKWDKKVGGQSNTAKYKKIVILGDSTIAAFSCRTTTVASHIFSEFEKSEGFDAVSLAVPGHTINQQLTEWNNYSEKQNIDIIIVQVGLNDLNQSSSTIIANYQALIDQINATRKPGAKVVISCMSPARENLSAWPNGYSNWLALNNAIMTTITGADYRNDYHVSIMSDGNGNLKSIYDCGDHVHENQAGADVIVQGFRNVIFKINPVDNTNKALKYFFEQPTGDSILDKDFQLLETGNPSLYNVSIQQNKILQSNNSLITYSESGYYFYVYKDIPLEQGKRKINRIDLSILLIGNSSGGNNANLVGVKHDGTTVGLLSYSGTAPTGLQNYSFDLTDFKSISLGLFVSGASGALDQHVKFYTEGLGAVEDSVYNLIQTKAPKSNDIDLIEFGCVGDGVTDDTAKFNEAIALAMTTGQRIYGRSGKYKVKSLIIPKTAEWKQIEIYGDNFPVPTYGTIGTVPTYATTQKGMVILSDYAEVGDKGVIYAEPHPSTFLNFSFVSIVLRNMVIRTYDNPKTCGIQALSAIQLTLENVFVDTGVYNVQASQPIIHSGGIVMPGHSNGAMSYLKNVWVSGYYYGIVLYEHVYGEQVVVHSNVHGLALRFAEHAIYFTRVLSQRNTNVVTVEGACRFEIAQLNCEYVGSGQSDSNNAWQKTQYELNDPSNLGAGRITYANSRGAVGANNVFRINGGANVIVKYINSDTRLTGAGVPDPNPIV